MTSVKEIFLPESKSIANRLLLLASFLPAPLPKFTTEAQDVVDLYQALSRFRDGHKSFTVRDGGTTFRFLLTRLSRENGEFYIETSMRLLERPHDDLYQALRDLGAEINIESRGVRIKSSGWCQPSSRLPVDCRKSTQYLTALALSSVDLPFALEIELQNLSRSQSYWQMTHELLLQAGLKCEVRNGCLTMPAMQKVKVLPACEPDMSSAFAAAVVGVVVKPMCLKNIPKKSLQGDSIFISLLREMGGLLELKSSSSQFCDLTIEPSLRRLRPLQADLKDAPDLFPVLAALCALVPVRSGENPQPSRLTGIGHIRFKESDRLQKTAELLRTAGAQIETTDESATILGPVEKKEFTFDPDHDHRMAMAAGVLKAAGVPVRILTPDVVNKSFPHFWRTVDVAP